MRRPGPPLSANAWNEIDATRLSAGWWYFTNGTTATDVGCGQWIAVRIDDLQTKLADPAKSAHANMAVSYSCGGKGRDHEW